ncbi:MAG: VWA domain-containing protein [Planctomycetota bacterium]|nr:MAG: VWA domain-containing protein [Planctomycetota bacterium]
MKRLWDMLFGLDRSSWTEGGRWRLDWISLPAGDRMLLLLAVLAILVSGLTMVYRWDARQTSRSTRWFLLSVRVLLIFVAVLMLLEPVLVLSKEEKLPSHLLVLVDNSPSMELRDAWKDESQGAQVAQALGIPGGVAGLREKTRLDLAKTVLSPEFLKTLSQDGKREVHVHTFSDRLRDEAEGFATQKMIVVSGQSTAIGSSLRQAQLAYNGMPLAGVLMVTDGRSTSGEAPESVAPELAEKLVPVTTLILGTPEGPRNVLVTDVETNAVALVKDSNRLTVHMQSRGLQDQAARVLLERRKNGGPWEEVGRQDVILGLDGALQTVDFNFTEESPTKLEFRATVEDAGPELSTDDNRGHAEVRIVRDRLHVLVIAGSAFPEVQFLKNAFYRDRKIEMSSWLQNADEDYEHLGDVPIRRLPQTQQELDDYDCVLLYDPDPTAWPPNFPEMLVNFVSKAGGGLAYVAGEINTANSFDKANDPAMAWLNLLPVVREPGLFRSEVEVKISSREPWKFLITESGLTDPVFTFADSREENQKIVDSLPGMFWHFPVTKAKPGATVLAVHGDPRMKNEYGPDVLMATQLVGPGRVLFVSFDSTYRWRYLSEQTFDGFWARVVDRAGRSKQLGGAYPFRLSTPQSSYTPGSQVKVVARFLDPAEMEPGLSSLHGEVEHGDGDPESVILVPTGGPGEFAVSFTANEPGQYITRVWMGDETAGSVARAATLPIDVRMPNAEYENPGIDRARLEPLAAATGGQVVDATQVAQIPASFSIGEVTRVLEDRQEIWDAPMLWGGLFLLLVIEWIVRKRVRLI